MFDIKLNSAGDIDVSPTGDIYTTESIRQAILIRLRWMYNEWRLAPEFGFPWMEEVFVKNPNLAKIQRLIRDEILTVEGVKSAEVSTVNYDRAGRSITFAYTCTIGEELFREEVKLHA